MKLFADARIPATGKLRENFCVRSVFVTDIFGLRTASGRSAFGGVKSLGIYESISERLVVGFLISEKDIPRKIDLPRLLP